MATTVHTAVLRGMYVLPVRLEVDVMRGLPGFYVVGLPGSSVREARERVRSSLAAAGKRYPLQRLVINLVPGNVPKQSTYFDLPIAVGLLAETGQVPSCLLSETVFIGELSLTGSVEKAQGVFLHVEHARSLGYKYACVPLENHQEASLVEGIEIIPVRSLADVCGFLCGVPVKYDPTKSSHRHQESKLVTFTDVVGQQVAKLALTVAAAGGHNILMLGPPGCGKTLLAQCLPELLPPLTQQEMTEVLRVHSAAGLFHGDLLRLKRPFRQVHHRSSATALLGGGRNMLPGEITLAHRGVLFLDELPEFQRDVLEALREPLEDRVIHINRADGRIQYPAACMLVAAMNPCKCGFAGNTLHACACTDAVREQYRRRISPPLLDRFDMSISMSPVSAKDKVLPEGDIHKNILQARLIQQERGVADNIWCNADIPAQLLKKYCVMETNAKAILELAQERYALSMRGVSRLMRVARTIADLSGEDLILATHVEQAAQFRQTIIQSSGVP